MAFLHAVDVDHPCEVDGRFELIDLLLEQQRVGAQEDELLALHEFFDDLRHLIVDQRLAAGDRDHRCAALFDRGDALLDREALRRMSVGMLDLSAAGAGQIALQQRLELEHQRVLLLALIFLLAMYFATAIFCWHGMCSWGA